jgi:4'-phosphopantetheinyl transferase
MGESARAAKFVTPVLQRRYLRSHAALRDILGRLTDARLEFALHEHGKPYLPGAPELHFNLAHSGEMALVAVALGSDVGVDVEHLRPLPGFAAIADRYFPPGYPPPKNGRQFFLYWTRLEAILKAQGVGLYGAGEVIEGDWMVREIDAGSRNYVAAVATSDRSLTLQIHDYGADE